MLSLNPRIDLGQLIFDDKFWIPELCDKYNQFLESKAYPIPDIRSVVMESLQTWEIPGLSQSVIKQPQFTGDGNMPQDVNFPDVQNKITAQGKTLTMTFRMDDAYINWCCMFEHMTAKLNNDKSLVASNFNVLVRNTQGYPIFTMVFTNCIFTGIDGMGIDYQNYDRSFNKFTCTWEMDKFEIDFTPPRQNVKGYDSTSGSTYDIDYNHGKPDIKKPCKPSLPQ